MSLVLGLSIWNWVATGTVFGLSTAYTYKKMNENKRKRGVGQ